MNWDFFNKLSAKESDIFLKNFLEEERVGFASIESKIKKDGIDTRFDVNNIENVLLWFLKNMETLPKEADDSLPLWIKESSLYTKGLFNFDEQSKILILRAGYFLGESFIVSNPKLFWSTGNNDTAEKNMPVVSGFKNKMEMSPLLILENVFMRILVRGAPISDISQMIEIWKESMP